MDRRSSTRERGPKKRFIDEEMFVPLNIRDSSLNVKGSKSIDTTVTVTMVMVGLAVAFFIFTSKGFMDITGFNMLATICIYIFAFTAIIYFISAKFIFKVDKRMKDRALEGSEIFDVNLGKIWRIRAGGIKPTPITSGEALLINYDGKPAFIFKRINTSIEGKPDNADVMHYKGLEQVTDTLISHSSVVSKLNLRHDTRTDNIWEYESRRLYQAEAVHGSTYVKVMQEIMNHRYDFTEKFSKVTSKYYIVICKPNTTVSEMDNIYETVKRYLSFTCSTSSLVNLEEFQMLLSQYYGLNSIDLNNMIPINGNYDNEGDSRVLDFVRADGTIDINKLPEVRIPELSTYDSLYPSGFLGVDVIKVKDDSFKTNHMDIFKQEYM